MREPDGGPEAASAGGDRLDRLLADHVADVAGYCRWRCASEDDAEDAISDVFLVAWRRLADIPEGDGARVWLLATARRVVANQRRARSRRHRLVERLRLVERPDRPEWPVEIGSSAVADALRTLDPADREILLLAVWEGLTSEQIGAVMGCLAVTARGRLYRARQRFRTAYEGAAYEGAAYEGAGAEAAGTHAHAPLSALTKAPPSAAESG